LLLDVVRVLPYSEPEDGNLAVHERAVLVRRAEQLELAAREREPRPAAAEAARGGARQLLFELGEVPESLLDRIGERTARLAAPALAGRRHDGPEQRVVVMAPAVVAYRRADILGDAVDPAQQILQCLLLQLGMLVERGVQVVDVRLVMFPVVDLHGLGVDIGFQRPEIVRQWRQGLRHGPLLRGLTGRPILHALCHRSATPFAAGWRAAGKMHGQRADFKPTRPRVARRVVPDDIVYCRNPEGTRSVPRPRPGAKEHAS